MTSLDVSTNTALTYLDCSWSNKLTELDVSDNTALKRLYCDYTSLTSLDVSTNTALTFLSLYLDALKTLYLKNGKNDLLFYDCKSKKNLSIGDITGSGVSVIYK